MEGSLLDDSVNAIAGCVLGGLDLEVVLLGGDRKEAPDAVSLPLGGFHNAGDGRSWGLTDHRQNLRAFASRA
jgi:hypothetical protein